MTEETDSALSVAYVGSVNRWECDENDHLNVRFYAEKVHQALELFVRDTAGPGSGPVQVLSQHIRFVREARMATPVRVECGYLGRKSDGWLVLSLMKDNLREEPLAGFVSMVERPGLGRRTPPPQCSPPAWATPRGIDPNDLYTAPTSLEDAQAAGFRTMGRGVIGEHETGEGLTLLPHIYIGRISDGMPNLWAFTADPALADGRSAGALGGAAVEYRLNVQKPLRAGDAFRHLSGIRAIGRKTQHMVHLLWNETADELSATAEAIGVAMDLATRRSVPISPDRRAHLSRLLLR